MARSRTVLIVDTNYPVATLQDILDDAANRPKPLAQKVKNFFHGLSGGAREASVKFGSVLVSATTVDAVAATLAGTFTGQPTAADTVTINGVVLTAVAEVATPTNNQFRLGTTPTIVAANMAAAINASTSDALAGVVRASSLAGVVTLTSLMPGSIGNMLVVSESLGNFTWAATSPSNGSGRLPILKTASFGK